MLNFVLPGHDEFELKVRHYSANRALITNIY